jgi:exopolysaccharide biosynthesis polyprenyl glycosylphosphotransferase
MSRGPVPDAGQARELAALSLFKSSQSRNGARSATGAALENGEGTILPPSAVAVAAELGARVLKEVGALREGAAIAVSLRRDALYKRTLAAADIVAGAGAVTITRTLVAHEPVTVAALLTLPVIVFMAHLAGLYHRDERLLHKTTLEEAPALFQVTALYSLLAWLSAELILGRPLHPREGIVLWGGLLTLMLVGRALGRFGIRQITPAERCLIVGDAETAETLRRKLHVSFSLKATVVGRTPLANEARQNGHAARLGLPILGSLENLGDTLLANQIERVIIAPNGSDDALETIRVVKALGVRISVLPRMLEVIGSSFEFDDIDGIALLGIRSSRLTRSSRALKRAMDLALATLGLIALSPVLVAAALAIKLTSHGSVLYRQSRIGRDGIEFEMLKLRTMIDGAEAVKPHLLKLNETEGLFKITDDPRVTPVGRFLRKSSLDELPQFWNVIRGEMSLVGPRPLVPDDDAKVVGWQRVRLNVTPGITGLWQILGSTRVPLDEMVKLDYLYGATWSLWLDVKILLRTVTYMVACRGA